MSHICRDMKYSGKHRFHSLEHYSKMRLFKAHFHPSTLRGYEASGTTLKQKTSNERRDTDCTKSSGNGRIDRRENYHFPLINAGNGNKWNRKRKTGNSTPRTKTKSENAGVNPAMKRHLLDTGSSKLFPEASPFAQVCGA